MRPRGSCVRGHGYLGGGSRLRLDHCELPAGTARKLIARRSPALLIPWQDPSRAYQGEGHLQHGSEGQGAVEEGYTVHEEGVVGTRAAQRKVLLARLLLLGHQQSVDGAVRVLGAVQHHLAVGLGGQLHPGHAEPGRAPEARRRPRPGSAARPCGASGEKWDEAAAAWRGPAAGEGLHRPGPARARLLSTPASPRERPMSSRQSPLAPLAGRRRKAVSQRPPESSPALRFTTFAAPPDFRSCDLLCGRARGGVLLDPVVLRGAASFSSGREYPGRRGRSLAGKVSSGWPAAGEAAGDRSASRGW